MLSNTRTLCIALPSSLPYAPWSAANTYYFNFKIVRLVYVWSANNIIRTSRNAG